jgi:hypothetical protein
MFFIVLSAGVRIRAYSIIRDEGVVKKSAPWAGAGRLAAVQVFREWQSIGHNAQERYRSFLINCPKTGEADFWYP